VHYVQSSGLPISIIIVGIGGADFEGLLCIIITVIFHHVALLTLCAPPLAIYYDHADYLFVIFG